MSLFNKNNDKDTVSLWKKEARRLEKERNQLYSELELIKGYKERYDGLIQEVAELKEKYMRMIKQTETLGDEYRDKLQRIVDKK